MTVTLQDRTAELIQPALDRAKEFLEKRVKDPQAAAEAVGRLRADVAGEGAALADVVIEAIFENIDAKRALYAQLEPRMRPDAVLATNTSSIKIEVLAEQLKDPSRLVGIHFFNPVAQMQLVEIVHGAATQEVARQRALWFTRKLDKLPLPCRSEPGFVVNRILMPYLNEALFALSEGIPAAVIDRTGIRFGMPLGPIELADVVGLDVALHVGPCWPRRSTAKCPTSSSSGCSRTSSAASPAKGFTCGRMARFYPPSRPFRTRPLISRIG
jgi:3-hydroxyacyl-CoA dehydrogenase/enoyl-CoA hydratase/3-hydroxybutyryl-CoA epimerase